jgi:hypothetical protein
MDGEMESMPESMDVAEAVERLEDGEPVAPGEGEGEVEATTEPAEAEAEEAPAPDPAPEFWSADDKAAWDAVPVELRPVLKKYEQQRVEFVNEKAREAAAVRAGAAQEVERAHATVSEAAAWWQQAGPALQRAFADKWGQVNWTELAEKDPKEWARLNQLRLDEAALLAEADRRGQADIEAAQRRAEQELQAQKDAAHAKLAEKLPDWFGTREIATKTYDEIGKFLFAKGIPADRINAIHEAPIIELALSAMRFEQAQQHALRSHLISGGRGGASAIAKPTPTRVVPGPASAAGNRQSDAVRQVGERFRSSGGSSIDDAAQLIRLNDL